MLEALRRIIWPERRREQAPPTPLTEDRIVAGYRMYWTKVAYAWDPARRALVAELVRGTVAVPEFENTMLERRFHVDGLDEQAHSGASLLALLEVLRAIESFEADAGHED